MNQENHLTSHPIVAQRTNLLFCLLAPLRRIVLYEKKFYFPPYLIIITLHTTYIIALSILFHHKFQIGQFFNERSTIFPHETEPRRLSLFALKVILIPLPKVFFQVFDTNTQFSPLKLILQFRT